MAKQNISIGVAPNDGTGDPIRTAFDKVNQNFTELYTNLNKNFIGLGNVDNTSDANKPVSTATQEALDGKSDSSHNHDLVYEPANANIQTHIASTSNPHGVTKAQVGLTNAEDKTFAVGVADATHDATSKTTPVDDDELPLSDSAASWGIKKLTWLNLKATLATWLETLTATWSNKTLTNPTVGGNLTFSGTGNRITGDFSNATFANRGMFQTSTVNGDTSLGVIPNGSATGSSLLIYNGSDPSNASRVQLSIDSTALIFGATYSGTGTYLPMMLYTGGAERVRIDTSGNVGIGSAPDSDTSAGTGLNVGAGKVSIQGLGNDLLLSTAATYNGSVWKYTATGTAPANYYQSGGTHVWRYAASGTDGNNITWTEAMRIDASGNLTSSTGASSGAMYFGSGDTNVGIDRPTGTNTLRFRGGGGYLASLDITTGFTVNNGTIGLGYGTGAGGTVTQSTSKSTAVTLNKPCGQITMHNATLAANTVVFFTFNNSLLKTYDGIVINAIDNIANPLSYLIQAEIIRDGTCRIAVKNIHTASLSESVSISFAVIKGATS